MALGPHLFEVTFVFTYFSGTKAEARQLNPAAVSRMLSALL